jgi:hypothetical protein
VTSLAPIRLKSADMNRAIVLVFLISSLTGCNRQTGYFHSTRMFTEVDRNAVTLVQGSALGKPEILKSIVAEYLKEDSPAVAPCSYKVSKVVRRDLKPADGTYAEELHVICLTSASELPFRFEWVLDQNQHLSEFKFGYDQGAVYD